MRTSNLVSPSPALFSTLLDTFGQTPPTQPLQVYVPPPQPLSPRWGILESSEMECHGWGPGLHLVPTLESTTLPREGDKARSLRFNRSLFSKRKSECDHHENRKLASEGNDQRHATIRPVAFRDLLTPFFPFIQFQQYPCNYATYIPKLNHSLPRQPKITSSFCVQLQDQGLWVIQIPLNEVWLHPRV